MILSGIAAIAACFIVFFMFYKDMNVHIFKLYQHGVDNIKATHSLTKNRTDDLTRSKQSETGELRIKSGY